MKSSKYKKYITSVLFFTFVFSGCDNSGTLSAPARYYYQNPNKKISNLGRIAIVELKNDSSYPQISNDITEALFQSL